MLEINIKEKKYGTKVIFNNTHLKLNSGVYILKGENGSGKTTFFNILYMEDLDFNGEIEFNKKNINSYSKELYRGSVCSYFTQDDFFFEDLFIKDILDLFNLGENSNKLLEELNLSNKKNKKYKKLSGGEKQKIRLIIAILSEANIILLDEPENNLDEESINIINRYIKSMNKIIIISSHTIGDMDHTENYNIINIKDKNIILDEKNKYNSDIKTESEIKNPKKKNVKINTIRKIIKNLNKPALFLALIILIFSIFLGLTISKLSGVVNSINRTRDIPYSENSTIIYPPVNNMLFDEFGDSKWLEIHDGYFTTDDYEKLNSLDYVTKVEPITVWNKLIYYPYTDDDYMLGPNLNYNDLNYEKYGMEKYKSSLEDVKVEYFRLMNKYDVLKNVPLYYSGHSDVAEIIYGRYPKDETNEIMIDIYMAMYISDGLGLDSLEDLLGKKVDIPAVHVDDYEKSFSDYSPNEINEKSYIISGIYVPLPSKEPTNKVYGSYDPDSLAVLENNYGLGNDKIGGVDKYKYTYYTIQGAHERVGSDYITLEDFQNKYKDNKMISGFYIEVSNPDYLDDLTTAIEKDDKYIEINNNYTIKNSNNFKYLSRNLRRLVFSFIVIQTIFIIIIISLYNYYETRNERNIKLLIFYGFGDDEVKSLRKQALLKLIFLNIFVIICVFIFLNHIGNLMNYIIIEYILIFIIIYVSYVLRRIK